MHEVALGDGESIGYSKLIWAAGGAPPVVFTDADYHKYLGHRSEAAGVTDFPVTQGISLPMGQPGDHADGTVWALVNRTAQLCADMLADGVRVFESTVEFVHQLQAAGIATAVFASRCDCARILDAAGLSDLFAARVDGPATRETVVGAPTRTDTLQHILHDAADRLAVSPRRCVVIDDTAAGVTAGRDGGFRSGHRSGPRRRCRRTEPLRSRRRGR